MQKRNALQQALLGLTVEWVRPGLGRLFHMHAPGSPMRYVPRLMQPPEPDSGRYGPYGGRYVAETLMPALDELTQA